MNRYNELKRLGFRFDHPASERGYLSRKTDYKIVPYIGRFGIGVKVIFPRTDTTQYVNIEYHILDSGVIYATNRYNGDTKRLNYDGFRNGKKAYKLMLKDYICELPKDKYYITLRGWVYLCN